ncbi:MAG TPA: hypothetical protein VLH58_06520, partial [Candidatus Methylomirabilis sp.]|nr:hypothetical protein [Candidatus Methylomirabilis sp.]
MCTSSRVRKPLAVLVASFLLFQWSVVPALAQTSPRPAQESKPTGGGTTAQASQGTSTAMEDPGPDAGIASPPGAFSVQAFQTDLFTGAAAATIPIVIPPGTAGVAPKLVLRYNSGTVDDSWMADNHPPLDQAPWTGLGWTLDVGGMILRDPKGTPETLADDTLKLVFDGVAHDLVLVDPGQWLYRTKDERFWRIQYVQSLDEWKLWTKDGTLHRFGSTRDGKGITYFGDLIHTYTYKYLLDEVVTPGGTGVRYAYYRQQATRSNGQTYDRALYPEFIRYTYQNGDPVGSAREIHFVRAARTDYTDSTATTRFSFFEDQLLDKIEVRVGGQFVRRYDFSYDYSIRRDPTYTWGGGATGDLTLRLVTQVGTDEVSTLPPLSFTYRDALLESVSNRFGGTVTYTYDPAPTNPIWSAHTTYSNWACGDFGVRTNRGPAECASSAVLLGHALRTNESGTIPLYSACNLLIESGSGYQCQDYGVSNSRGTYPASTFARLVGYVFPTSQPGTRQIFSTYKSVIVDVDQIAHCVDMGISDTLVPLCCVCVPTGGLLENEPVGYVPLTGVDRARVITRGVNDGRGTLGTTTYAYGTPQWGGPHGNEFWGHSWVRVTDPAGHYSTVWYHQDEAKKGRASQVETRSSTGALFTRVENTWTTSTPSPGVTVVALTETNGYTYDGDSSFKQVRQTFAYDAYGNATELHHEGDVAASGDERTEVLEYAYNTGAYIVGLPSHTVTRDASETPVAEAWLHYDGATSHTTPPTAGRLTKQCHWLDGGTNPCVELTYDEWGNVHTVKDARGNITTVDYDTAHRTFPASVTTPATPNAPNGLTTTYTYDEKFGAVLTTRDPNNQTTTNGYDRFGRLTSVTNALNQTTTISYPNLGNPATQHVRVELPDGQGGVLWTQTYFDGLGRTYRVKKNAAAGVVLLDTAYDTRGLVASKALPRFEGATSVPIAYGYDALGRLTRTDYPDDTFETAAYSDWTTMITDRNGHARSSLKDAYGRVTQITEPGGALTHYGYDTMGRLTSVTDAASHITSIVYDTLGRKIRMTEPNMGTWTYSYDANGNLLTQIDAKHQPLAFQYDALNRLTTKTYPGPGFYPLTRSEKSGFEGYTALYRGGMCLAGCTGGDVWTKAGLGPSLGYMKDSEGTGTQPVYPSTCYSDSAGTCTGWGLSLDANGSPVGYLSQTNPNPGVALTQSGGLLYQGLGGTPSAYLWTSPPAATRTDHFYTTDGTVPLGYTEQGLLGYLAEVGGSGTVTLTRY